MFRPELMAIFRESNAAMFQLRFISCCYNCCFDYIY